MVLASKTQSAAIRNSGGLIAWLAAPSASLAGPMRGLQDWHPDDTGPELKS